MNIWSITKPLVDWKWPFLTTANTSKKVNTVANGTDAVLGKTAQPIASVDQKERTSKDIVSTNSKSNDGVMAQEPVLQEHSKDQIDQIADTGKTAKTSVESTKEEVKRITITKEEGDHPAVHINPPLHVKSQHPKGYGYVNSRGHHTGRHKPNAKTYKPPYHDAGAYIELTHGLTYYELHGFEGEGSEDKEIVILLHGLSWWSFTWELMVPHLVANNLRVITFDFYGRGLSAAPYIKYDNQLLAAQAYELLTKLKLGRKVTMIGFSMGGGVAGTFASQHHDMLNRLILIGPVGSPVQMPLVAKIVALPMLGWCIYWAFAKLAMQRSLKTDQCKSDFAKPEKVSHLIGRYIDYSEWCIENKEGFFEALYSTTMHFPFSDLLNVYSKIPSSLPVLLLWGEKDHLVPIQNHKLLLNAMPQAKFFSIPDAGHTCFLEEPDLTHKHIIDFISTSTNQTQRYPAIHIRNQNRSHGPHFFHHKPVHMQHQPSHGFHTLIENDPTPTTEITTNITITTPTTPISDTA